MPPERALLAADAGDIAAHIVRWQGTHGRSTLPWQATRDPYRVWLSEVMLQQTQVSTVLGYFDRFLARCPSVADLAAAPEDDVLGLWSGLGYYSRARSMHRCAQEVVARFGGEFPRSAALLQTLPGIGRSTAAAIASFCFGERVAILDGNVKRVLTRLLGFDADLALAASERQLWARATELLPTHDLPRAMPAYTQGVMDLGATVCLPRRPNCLLCPVSESCVARRAGDPERYPVKTRKLRRSAQALWLLRAVDADGRVWLHKRPARGIWGGLYCLPVFDSRDALTEALPAVARSASQDAVPFVHVLTHKDLHLHPVDAVCAADAPAHEGAWFTPNDWTGLGLPAPIRKLLLALRLPLPLPLPLPRPTDQPPSSSR